MDIGETEISDRFTWVRTLICVCGTYLTYGAFFTRDESDAGVF